jgi:mersacidin/lichenicidin family type 2 lantibiotic
MTHLDIIRAWKDEEYRLSLSAAERAQLPAHPAGLIALTDAELAQVGGGSWGPLLDKALKFKEVLSLVGWLWSNGKAASEAFAESCVETPGSCEALVNSI